MYLRATSMIRFHPIMVVVVVGRDCIIAGMEVEVE